MNIIFGLFIVLHGLVHLLYAAHSARFFELKPGMVWPDGSWAFARLLGNESTRSLASVGLILAALGLAAGGAGILFGQAWGRTVAVAAAAFSALIYLLLWDGGMQNLDGQGAVGILIDLAILLAVLVFCWPAGV